MLEIPNFQQEDAGSYECIAENSRGKNVARGRLTYYGEPSLECIGFLAFALSIYCYMGWRVCVGVFI